MEVLHEALNGAMHLRLPKYDDPRGFFTKTFHKTSFEQLGINFQLAESYYSLSHKGVIRGMHFQTPPYEHAKIVCCTAGSIYDVMVDLRKQSPTYGQHYAAILSADNHEAFYIPPGFAHGFQSLTSGALTNYLVSSEYAAAYDSGLLYNSCAIEWPLPPAEIAARDLSFGTLNTFQSPF